MLLTLSYYIIMDMYENVFISLMCMGVCVDDHICVWGYV